MCRRARGCWATRPRSSEKSERMMTSERKLAWDWYAGVVPENVELDGTAYLETTYSFLLFRSRRTRAVEIGRGASIYLGTMFDLGPKGRVKIGRYSLINGARIIC